MEKREIDKRVCDWSLQHGVAMSERALNSLVDMIDSEIYPHAAIQRFTSISDHAEIAIELWEKGGHANGPAMRDLKAKLEMHLQRVPASSTAPQGGKDA